MATDILIRFLSAGLINVGGDDAKLDRLKETVADLAAILKKTPSKAAPFALIALDPEAPANDPVIKEVAEVLQRRWATYVNTFSGTPIAVIRAMLLDAIIQAAGDDEKVGVALATSARNVLPFMEADNERSIWCDAIGEIERRVDDRAEAEWAVPSSLIVPAMTFSAPAAIDVGRSPVTINQTAIAKRIEAAVGPSNAASETTNGNTQWPNQGPAWAYQFAPRMTELLAETFGAIAKGVAIPQSICPAL